MTTSSTSASQSNGNDRPEGVARPRSARGVPWRGNLLALLEKYHEQGGSALNLIQERVAQLQEQIPVLQRLASNATVPSNVRTSARMNILDTNDIITDIEAFRTNVLDWMRMVRAAEESARAREAPHQPSDEVGMQAIIDLAEHYKGILISLRDLVDEDASEVNRNFFELHGAYLTLPSTTEPPPPPPEGWGGVGVLAAGQGMPENVKNYMSAYHAEWSVQATMFRLGERLTVDGHVRCYKFSDGSYVTIKSYQPRVGTSSESDIFCIGATAVGAAVGSVVGPAGALVGAVAMLLAVSAIRPNDVAWQGYTAAYFRNRTDSEPWAVQSFYGLKHSPSIMAQVSGDGVADPAHFRNFADLPGQDYSWWRWVMEPAAARAGRERSDSIDESLNQVRMRRIAEHVDFAAGLNQLVQAMAALFPPAATGSPSVPASGVSVVAQPMLVQTH